MRNVSELVISNLFKNVTHDGEIQALAKSAKKIEVICPFITEAGSEWLLKKRADGAQISLITELCPRSVLNGVLSLKVLERMLEAGCEVRAFSEKLHAKFYWFDRQNAVITSANLTAGGMHANFEMGVRLSPGILNESILKKGNANLAIHLGAIWSFVYGRSTEVTIEKMNHLKSLCENAAELFRQAQVKQKELDEQFEQNPFTKFQRECFDRDNLATHLGTSSMFQGFAEKDWAVFDHNLAVTEENITSFRYALDDAIDPLLKRFTNQMLKEPVFKKSFGKFDRGISKHVQLKSRFPDGRYVFLTRPRPGKVSYKHLGEPSFLIGMGKDDSGCWLEVRTGVEEFYFNELTPSGARLLKNISNNLAETARQLNGLAKGWIVSHGNYSQDALESVPAHSMTADHLKQIVNQYLSSGEASDFQVRRKYRLSDPADAAVALSPKVTSLVAFDIERLSYFFELAHQ